MPSKSAVKKRLPERASLENLRKQAKRFLKDLRAGNAKAISRLNSLLPCLSQEAANATDATATTLSEAQLVIAREYGFPSWPALKAAVEARCQDLSAATADPGEQGSTVIDTDLIEVPLLPLRDLVVFPNLPLDSQMPLLVGRAKSLSAVEAAPAPKPVFLCMQLDLQTEDPGPDDIFHFGTLATVTPKGRSDDGTTMVHVRADRRARALQTDFSGQYAIATVRVPDEPLREVSQEEMTQAKSLIQRIGDRFNLPPGFSAAVREVSEPGRLADVAAQYLNLSLQKKQMLLQLMDPKERLDQVVAELHQLLAELRQLLDEIEHPAAQ